MKVFLSAYCVVLIESRSTRYQTLQFVVEFIYPWQRGYRDECSHCEKKGGYMELITYLLIPSLHQHPRDHRPLGQRSNPQQHSGPQTPTLKDVTITQYLHKKGEDEGR